MEIRENFETKKTFMRFQVGETIRRKLKIPHYNLGSITHYTDSEVMEPVFLLKGCGSTLKAAEIMAAIRNWEKPKL
jgi:hypothetical protein